MKFIYRTIIILTLSLLGFSCHSDLIDGGNTADGEVRNIPLRIMVDNGWDLEQDIATAETRGPSSEYQIQDLWIFQFDGEGEDAVMVSTPKYFKTTTITIPFVSKGTKQQRIVVVANMNDDNYAWGFVPDVATYGDLLDRARDITKESDLYPGGPLMLYGTVMSRTDGTPSTIPVTLKHNAVKFELNLTCTTSQLTITSVQLCNMPSKQWLVGEGRNASEVFPDVRVADRLDYAAYTASADLPGSGGIYKTYLWYTPANMQGSAPHNTNPKAKNAYAPVGATYVKVTAVDNYNAGATVEYIFYPGSDMVSDFNMRPNYHYKLYVRITGIDDYEVDTRIEYKTRIFDRNGKPANSYILNIPGTLTNTYRIYPTQVDRFWGAYEGVHEYKLNHDTDWTVDVLWMDLYGLVSLTDASKVRITKSTGRGVNNYFEITVPHTASPGNFVVYLYRTDDPEKKVLWSWHMWVTNYNPDISRLAATDTQFVYPVENGNVERYKGAIWEEGIYRNSFMMDRYLGRNETYLNNSINSSLRGVLVYQYGRKDPMTNNITRYDLSGAAVGNRSETGGRGSGVRIRDYVLNPLTQYAQQLDFMIPDNTVRERVWLDKFTKMPVPEMRTNEEKSIYDPCPYGWKVPNAGTWEDFRPYITTHNEARGLQYYRHDPDSNFWNYAVRYWPMIDVNGEYPVWGTIKYLVTGYRDNDNTWWTYNYVRLWYNSYYAVPTESSPTPMVNDHVGMSMYISASQTTEFQQTTTGMLYSVRCVSHSAEQ